MSRLYDVNIDEKRWKITELDDKNYHTYKLVDKEMEEVYYLNHIIGVEQVNDDEFLIYRRASYDDFQICRYKLQDSKFIKLFEKEFSKFEFITDDRILFSYWGNTGPYRNGGIYSIKDNDYVEDGKWLDMAVVEIHEDENDNIVLYVEDSITSHRLDNPKLLYTVDPHNLEPNFNCYSELRNRFIEVGSKEDIINIKNEDKKYVRQIEDILFQQKRNQLKEIKGKILTRTKRK